MNESASRRGEDDQQQHEVMSNRQNTGKREGQAESGKNSGER